MTEREAGRIEGAADAIQRMMLALSGDNSLGKTYDPMTVRDGVMHSYAFDMKDGTRHHPISDYEGVDEIIDVLVAEGVEWIRSA